MPTSATGICGTRLQARNVNLLPEALQIVVLDRGLDDPTPDDMARFVTWLPGGVGSLIEAATGISFNCNPPYPPANQRLHLIDSRSVTSQPGTTAACSLPMTPACGSL